jgi:hypothetical protein
LDDITRYVIEGQLADKWSISTSNIVAKLSTINTYAGINTYITILLQNWTLPISTIYVGYNTDLNSTDNLIIIGSYTIATLNDISYIKFNYIFPTANTYYIHLVNQSNVEYASISKKVIVSDLSNIIQISNPITIADNNVYNLELINWSDIVNTIGLYSAQIYSFNAYISPSDTDPDPTFIENVLIQYNNSIYTLPIPGLLNANNKYLYLKTTINSVDINIPPILIESINFSLSCNPQNGILNTSTTFELSINNLPSFYTLYPTVYLYYATLPNLTSGLTLINSYSVPSTNIISFNLTTSEPVIYFYLLTNNNFSGIISYVGPINFIDISLITITLDSYDTNTNFRNILLNDWSSVIPISSMSVLSGVNSDYSNQTLVTTKSIETFVPTSIYGLNAWYDASTLDNFIIDTSITQWNDNSGNNNNATNPDIINPSYDSVNKGVNFTGGKYLYLPYCTIPFGDDNYCIFIVLTPSTSTSEPQAILSSFDQIPPSTNMTNSFFTYDNKFVQSWNNGSDLNSSTYDIDTKQIVSFEYISGVNRTTYINGVSSGTDVPASRNSSKTYNLMGGIYGNNTFTNLIHEILIYKNTLSAIQRQNVEKYLTDKWLVT